MMNVDTLATELENLTPTLIEAEAAQALADAYGVYCTDAESNGVPITTAAITAGKAAMALALVGMSIEGQSAAKIAVGMAAFWGAVAPLLSGAFTGAIAMTPPTLAGLGAKLEATFPTNLDKSLEDAMAAIAINVHSETAGPPESGIGTVTFTGPTGPFPIV